jgi:hypothetical protein
MQDAFNQCALSGWIGNGRIYLLAVGNPIPKKPSFNRRSMGGKSLAHDLQDSLLSMLLVSYVSIEITCFVECNYLALL